MQPTTLAPVATTQRTTIVAQSPAGHQLLEALAAIQAEFQAKASAGLPTGAIVLEPATDLEPAQYIYCHGFHSLRWMNADGSCGIDVQHEIGLQRDGSAPAPTGTAANSAATNRAGPGIAALADWSSTTLAR